MMTIVMAGTTTAIMGVMTITIDAGMTAMMIGAMAVVITGIGMMIDE
ncbi:hypothetical protein GIW70_06285 [Pseudomonas syringae]|nr:hypothetical protein [Pseudomonas syringae]MCF5067805.1 hypothetical protein [Pseudomonas syringae]